MTRMDIWRIEIGNRGVIAAGRWFWPRVTAWLVGLFAFATLALFSSFQLPDWLHQPDSSRYPTAILLPLAALALYALAVWIGERRAPRELALKSAPAYLVLGWIAGFAFIALSLALLWVLHLNEVSRGHWRDWFHYLVFNAYVSAVVEELGFRAILLRLLARMFGPMPGLIISAALFALAHADHTPAVGVALLVLDGGLFLGILYMVSGSLWLPIGAHLAYDFTEWSLMGVGDSDGYLVVMPSPHHAAWLTGAGIGPDGSILSGLVALLLIGGVIAIGLSRARTGNSIATSGEDETG